MDTTTPAGDAPAEDAPETALTVVGRAQAVVAVLAGVVAEYPTLPVHIVSLSVSHNRYPHLTVHVADPRDLDAWAEVITGPERTRHVSRAGSVHDQVAGFLGDLEFDVVHIRTPGRTTT